MKIKAVDYVSYPVSNLKRSIDFYQNILGLRLDSSGDEWAEFDVGNMWISLSTFGTVENKGAGPGIALAVDDIGAALQELKKKGVKTDGEIWETPVCHGASIQDPDGNMIYLHKRKDGTAG